MLNEKIKIIFFVWKELLLEILLVDGSKRSFAPAGFYTSVRPFLQTLTHFHPTMVSREDIDLHHCRSESGSLCHHCHHSLTFIKNQRNLPQNRQRNRLFYEALLHREPRALIVLVRIKKLTQTAGKNLLFFSSRGFDVRSFSYEEVQRKKIPVVDPMVRSKKRSLVAEIKTCGATRPSSMISLQN